MSPLLLLALLLLPVLLLLLLLLLLLCVCALIASDQDFGPWSVCVCVFFAGCSEAAIRPLRGRVPSCSQTSSRLRSSHRSRYPSSPSALDR